MEAAISYIALLLFLPLLFLLYNKKTSPKNLPPGELGVPIIGQSFELLRAMRANTAEDWLKERVRKYGPVSKLHLFGSPTVFLHGQEANKFIYTCSEKTLANKQPAALRMIMGKRNILELSGADHTRIREALVSFLKPEALKQSVGVMDHEIKMHLNHHWHGEEQVEVMPLMKALTFDVIFSLIFGIERGAKRNVLVELFDIMIEGQAPVNLPFYLFNRSLRARSKIRRIVLELIREKRQKLKSHDIMERQDLITSLLSMRDKNNKPLLSDEEIVDNCIVVMVAGHDTTSILLTFLIKLLAEKPDVYQNVLKEHEEIARGKESTELLTWEDLEKMKYTWKVATESMRMNPPVFCSFRTALQEFEIGGYVIPKGWKVFWAGFMTHLDESIFADPLKFDPSRFDNQEGAFPYSYIVFGGGPRMCPGYEFVRLETLILIHYLITGFNWRLASEENFFGRDPLPTFSNGLPVNIELKM